MTKITHEALEALSKKATFGTWFFDGDWHRRPVIHGKHGVEVCQINKSGWPNRSDRTTAQEADAAFIVALVNLYRTGQLIHAVPSGDEVEAVARAVAEYQIGVGLPSDDAWEDAHGIATAAIARLDAVRGKQ